GTITGTGNLTVPNGGQFNWYSGAVLGTGALTVAAGAALGMATNACCSSPRTLGRNLTNNGSATWSGNVFNFLRSDTFQPTITNTGTFAIDLTSGSLNTDANH